MDDEVIERRLAHIDGQLLATQAAVRALIMASEKPVGAARWVASTLEMLTAKGLGSEATNDWQLRGIETARRAMLPP